MHRKTLDALAVKLSAATPDTAKRKPPLLRALRLRDRRRAGLSASQGPLGPAAGRRLFHTLPRQEPDLRAAGVEHRGDSAGGQDQAASVHAAEEHSDPGRVQEGGDADRADRVEASAGARPGRTTSTSMPRLTSRSSACRTATRISTRSCGQASTPRRSGRSIATGGWPRTPGPPGKTCGCGWRATSPTRSATRDRADAGRGLGRGRRHRSETLAGQLSPGLFLGADPEALGMVEHALQLGLCARSLAILVQHLGIAIARLEPDEPLQQRFDLARAVARSPDLAAARAFISATSWG